MRIYRYDYRTHVYLGSATADADQMHPGNYIIPAFATSLPPPPEQSGHVPVFNMEKNKWEMKPTKEVSAQLSAQLSAPQRIGVLRQQVQAMADAAAVSQGFDSMAEAVSYADEPAVPEFQEKGASLRAWRSVLWKAFEDMEREFKSGEKAIPISFNELSTHLPSYFSMQAAHSESDSSGVSN